MARAAIIGVLFGAVLASYSPAATPATASFSRYESILNRKPFGDVPKVVAAPIEVPKEIPPNSPLRSLEMVAITETESGLRVGLVNSQTRRTYFLFVGQTEDGFELLDADFAGERAYVGLGDERTWLSMGAASKGGDSGPGPMPIGASFQPSSVSPMQMQTGVSPVPMQAGVSPAPAAAPSPAIIRRTSYAERLRLRREAEAERLRKMAERPQIPPEELEIEHQVQQIEALRRGDPPLPVPLTPEADSILVQEGVLPPIDQ